MNVKFEDETGNPVTGEVVATVGDWYQAWFVISLSDGTFVQRPIDVCTKIN